MALGRETQSNDWRITKLESSIWTKYKANELPTAATPVWTKSGATTTEEIVAGVFHVAGAAPVYNQDPSNTGDCTLELRMKVVSGEGSFDIANDDDYYYVECGTANVKLIGNTTNDSYVMDTTDDFHVYRLLIESHVGKLYIDGILRITLDDGDGGWAAGYVSFYLSGGEGYFDYVYYRTDGAFAPGAKSKYLYLPDLLVHKLGTSRNAEILGKIGDDGKTYEAQLNEYIDGL